MYTSCLMSTLTYFYICTFITFFSEVFSHLETGVFCQFTILHVCQARASVCHTSGITQDWCVTSTENGVTSKGEVCVCVCVCVCVRGKACVCVCGGRLMKAIDKEV